MAIATNSTGPVAQRSEQGTHNPLVVGSIPTGPTIFSLVKILVLISAILDLHLNNHILGCTYRVNKIADSPAESLVLNELLVNLSVVFQQR